MAGLRSYLAYYDIDVVPSKFERKVKMPKAYREDEEALDVQDIRKSLEEIRKDIADGKATEALKAINDMDNKLLVAMSDNPPPMLEKSTGNDNNN